MWRLFKNKEIKIYLLVMVVLHLALTSTILISLRNNTEKMQQALIQERIALLGSILTKHPELESEIIPFITEKATPEQMELGFEVAKRYGLDYDLPIGSFQLLDEYQRQSDLNVIKYGLLFLGISTFLGLIILNKIYGRVRTFSRYAESIVEGDFEPLSESQEEGDFAMLTLQYNHMAKRLQGSLENLQQEKLYLKNIVSDISHQLKTPLSSIKMFNELLMDGEIGDLNTASDFLGKSQSQIERMEWLIQNLLKMAKLDTNSVEFKNQYTSLNETVENAIAPLEESWQEKQLEVTVKAQGKHQLCHDQHWMCEAISNVVKNAVEHTPQKGKISIDLKETPLAVKIQIDNEGPKIPNEDIPHIFQRFYKGRNNPRANSTGIGLALAKAIVEYQNGSIEVRNNPRGPSFLIYLYKQESF